jgi:chromosome segregation ATPase
MLAENLASTLVAEVERTNQLFSRWAADREEWLLSTDAAFESSLEESQCTLQALKDSEEQLESIRSEQDFIKAAQRRDVEMYEAQIARLTDLVQNLAPQRDAADAEEALEERKLREVVEHSKKASEDRKRSLQELTRGVLEYSRLGLEFQKADSNVMKFIFTLMERENPTEPYTFYMFVDNADQYQLVEIVPPLDPAATGRAVDALNADNDIGRFVVAMRKLFCEKYIQTSAKCK